MNTRIQNVALGLGLFLLSVNSYAEQSLWDTVTSETGRAELNALTRSEETLNRVTLLHLGKASQPARLKAIGEATRSIYMDVPYWFSDTEGKRTYGALAEKVEQNPELDLRILFDWATPAQSKDLWEKKVTRDLRKLTRGALLKWNMPEWRRPWSIKVLKNHMHDKMIIVDNRTLIMGGLNIADTYLNGGLTRQGWHDTDLQIDGPAAADASKLFLKTWELTKYLADELHNPIPISQRKFRKMLQNYYYEDQLQFSFRKMGIKVHTHFPLEERLAELEHAKRENTRPEYTTSVRLMYDNPLYETESKTLQTLKYLLKNAKQRVRLFTPYLTITDEMEDALAEAAKRIPVEIITNSAIAHDLRENAYIAAASHYPKLMDAGAKVYEWQGHKPLLALEKKNGCEIPVGEWPGNTLHTKAVMIDGVVTVLGSHNMNTRSELSNTELMAVMLDPEITKQMEEVFQSDLDLSDELLVRCDDRLIERPRRVEQVDRKKIGAFLKKNAQKVRLYRRMQNMM